jgi:hypothetical protein
VSEAEDAWIEANAPKVAKALDAAQDELYDLLGGQADPDRRREEAVKEVRRLRLTWRYPRS